MHPSRRARCLLVAVDSSALRISPLLFVLACALHRDSWRIISPVALYWLARSRLQIAEDSVSSIPPTVDGLYFFSKCDFLPTLDGSRRAAVFTVSNDMCAIPDSKRGRSRAKGWDGWHCRMTRCVVTADDFFRSCNVFKTVPKQRQTLV